MYLISLAEQFINGRGVSNQCEKNFVFTFAILKHYGAVCDLTCSWTDFIIFFIPRARHLFISDFYLRINDK